MQISHHDYRDAHREHALMLLCEGMSRPEIAKRLGLLHVVSVNGLLMGMGDELRHALRCTDWSSLVPPPPKFSDMAYVRARAIHAFRLRQEGLKDKEIGPRIGICKGYVYRLVQRGGRELRRDLGLYDEECYRLLMWIGEDDNEPAPADQCEEAELINLIKLGYVKSRECILLTDRGKSVRDMLRGHRA